MNSCFGDLCIGGDSFLTNYGSLIAVERAVVSTAQ